MEALSELCDLIANNPVQFKEKLAWICARCPSPESIAGKSPRVSRSQLHALMAVAKFLSQCSNPPDHRPQTVLLQFLRSIPATFQPSFWPQSFPNSAISSFYSDFFRHVCKATKLSPDFAAEVAGFFGDIVVSAWNSVYSGTNESGLSRVCLIAFSESCPGISPPDAEKLISLLLEQLPISSPLFGVQSVVSSVQSSPASLSYLQANGISSPVNGGGQLSGSFGGAGGGSRMMAEDATSTSSSRVSEVNGMGSIGWKRESNTNAEGFIRQQIAHFEEESAESLQMQEIAFKLIGQILAKVSIDCKVLEQVRLAAKRQLQSSAICLKVNFFWAEFLSAVACP